MRKSSAAVAVFFTTVLSVAPSHGRPPANPQAIDRLIQDSGGSARVSLHRATGYARFVRLDPGKLTIHGRDAGERASDFLRRYGTAFGIRSSNEELTATGKTVDRFGAVRVRYQQVYQGLPVFGSEVRVHFDPRGRLVAANGTFVPGIALDPHPRRSIADAENAAVSMVRDLYPGASSAAARRAELMVYRTGLLQGIPGTDHLAYQIEVGDGGAVREFVFVDANTDRVIDHISGIQHAIHRTIHEPQFNNVVIWNEGNPLPFDSGDPARDGQVNTLIDASLDTYALFANLSGGTFLSWNGADGVMHNVFNIPSGAGVTCPNAFWDGAKTNYCNGVTSDNTVAHEWTHGYTEKTHNLIYVWQSGALNEAYSDIFGEVVDILNGTGTDAPAPARSPGGCSTLGGSPPPHVEVLAPQSIAGIYAAGGADFNPDANLTVTALVSQADDGDTEGGLGTVTDACQPLLGFPAGRIALIDRGRCPFVTKVINAQNAGASGVLIANFSDTVINMGGTDPSITIPSALIHLNDGFLIQSELPVGVTARITIEPAADMSYRWLLCEDCPAFGGAIRDMWDPTCFGDPGRVTDVLYYSCLTEDNGGVHTNSGVPNHAFALLVDGGTYNGRTVGALGLTRASHLYWRAMEVYQVTASDFGDHADALEQSCTDLLGIDLEDLTTGAPSGQSLSAADCAQVAEAMLAVEMRAEPTFCNFVPMLDPNPPAVACGSELFFDDLETNPAGRWFLSNAGVYAEYLPRDWLWTASVPAGGAGKAFFALDSPTLGDCTTGSNNQSGVMHLDSPLIAVPAAGLFLTFDHYVATERRFDGGNLKISRNGGPFLAINQISFRFNLYNAVLASAASGNTNPIAGQQAFSGSNGGENRGSWGQSQVDLSSFASPGDLIRLRFDFGVNGCGGLEGWYVDNPRLCLDCSGPFAADADGDGFRPCDGDCNDGDATTYQDAPEVNDGLDNQCAGSSGFGLVDEISGPLGFFNPADLTEISWPAQGGAVSYQVARSETASFSPPCVTFSAAAAVVQDPDLPAIGAAYHYLVRALTPNVGSWGRSSAGTERSLACAPPSP